MNSSSKTSYLSQERIQSKPSQTELQLNSISSTQSSGEGLPEINRSDEDESTLMEFETLSLLQEGHSNISIYLVRAASGMLYARKVRPQTSALSHLRREFEIMTSLDHPNIVQGLAYSQRNSEESILMEYCPGEDLHKLISSRKLIPEDEAKRYFSALARALQECHRKEIAHLDVKPENCFISSSGDLKLGDFGFAQSSLSRLKPGLYGTVCYNSPEIRMQLPFDGKPADIFSAGLVLFRMVAGFRPFAMADGKSSEFRRWLANKEEFWKDVESRLERNLYMSIRFSSELKSLISRMLEYHPRHRPTIDQVLASPWLTPNSC